MEKNTLPIVEWRVSEENICLNNKNNYLSSRHQKYKLVNVPRVSCKEFDDRFINLDSMSEKDYFKMNFFENIEDKLPGYKLSDEILWNLYYRSMLNFRIECRSLMSDLKKCL